MATSITQSVTPEQVRAFRVRAQQLDRTGPADLAGTTVLDLGAQDSGPDGGLWALALRGVDVAALTGDELVTAWTVRGAPHLHRRDDLPGVAAATRPSSEADAAKRVYDAAKPLRAAGIAVQDALDAVAATMRAVVVTPTVKGAVSREVAARMGAPYLRECRSCRATHLHEMPFRLAALRGGLVLQAGTSPPVLERVPGWDGPAPGDAVPEHLDVVRGYLRLLGPAAPQHVAAYLDAPVRDVAARWPDDALEVAVDGQRRWVLTGDAAALDAGPVTGVRLLGPFDLFLQARDREVLVGDPALAKALWPVIGRPGAVLADGAVVGTWRPRASGGRLTVAVEAWVPLDPSLRSAVEEQAERLAAHRGVRLAAVDLAA